MYFHWLITFHTFCIFVFKNTLFSLYAYVETLWDLWIMIKTKKYGIHAKKVFKKGGDWRFSNVGWDINVGGDIEVWGDIEVGVDIKVDGDNKVGG